MGFLQSVGKAIGSVASPIVSGAFGIGSALLNNKAQQDANQTNLRIAQMNNEWSEKMMEKQHLYDVELWNKNNEYNDPSKQVERLKSAGINPALALGNVGSGQASGVNSVGLPSPSSASVQPMRYEGFANAINNTVQMSMALTRQNAELDALERNTDARVAEAKARVAEMAAKTDIEKFDLAFKKLTRDLSLQNMSEDYLRKVQERTNMEEQQKLIQQQVIAQQLINENLPQEISMRIAVMASQRDLNNKNIESVAKDIVLKAQEAERTNYSKDQFERLKDATVRALESGITQGWISSIGSGIGSVFGGIGSIGRKPTKVYSPHTHQHKTYINNNN